jgi:hypothetical protein
MRKRLLALLATIALAAANVFVLPSVAAVEYPCAPGEVQIEDQAWWIDATGEEWPGRHVHQQLCWPTGIVTGTFSQNVRIILHDQPAGAELTRIRITDGGGATLWSQDDGFPAISSSGDLTYNVTVSFPTSGLSTGIHEMRLATIVDQPNGAQQFVSSGHPLYVRASTGGATSRDYHEARGWYTEFDYTNARLKLKTGQTGNSALAALRTVTPGQTFVMQCAAPSGEDPDVCTSWLDPDAHNGNPGTLLANPAVSGGSATATVTIPSNITPGLHKIVVARSEATADLGPVSDGTNSGLFVVTVLVEGTPPPTPTPTAPPTPSPTPEPTPEPTPTPTIVPTPSICT